jgi:hypothetical protein
VRLSNGSSDEQPILKLDNPSIHQHARDWSLDGGYVLFERSDAKKSRDLWLLPLFGNPLPVPFLQTEFEELGGQFSPDRQFVAYTSDETGRFEVYVRSFLGSAGKWQISVMGGTHPRWRRDGKEIFYLGPDNALMVVSAETKGRFDAGAPSRLFDVPLQLFRSDSPDPYAVAPDGQRFLVMTSGEALSTPLTVTLNWPSALRPQR